MKVYFNNNLINTIYRPHINKVARFTNLAPLKQDTVSFTHDKNSGKNIFTFPENKKNCDFVHKNAEPARCYLEELLTCYLSPILKEYDSNSTPPFTFVTKIKSSNSIKQKTLYKVPENIKK